MNRFSIYFIFFVAITLILFQGCIKTQLEGDEKCLMLLKDKEFGKLMEIYRVHMSFPEDSNLKDMKNFVTWYKNRGELKALKTFIQKFEIHLVKVSDTCGPWFFPEVNYQVSAYCKTLQLQCTIR